MTGLVPVIHAVRSPPRLKVRSVVFSGVAEPAAWLAGTSPAMTKDGP